MIALRDFVNAEIERGEHDTTRAAEEPKSHEQFLTGEGGTRSSFFGGEIKQQYGALCPSCCWFETLRFDSSPAKH